MSWKYTYSSYSDFLIDFETEKTEGVWFSYGKIDSVQFNAVPDSQNNSVIIYALQPGSRIRNLNRYSFSLETFLTLEFSTELPGLVLYIQEDPTARTPGTWDTLSQSQQNIYIDRANRLVLDNNLYVYWPKSAVNPIVPNIELYLNSTRLQNGDSATTTAILDESDTLEFTIKNSGFGLLSLRNTPPISIVGDSENFILTPPATLNFLKDDTSTFTLQFQPRSLGNKTLQIIIPNNDPEDGGFVLNIIGETLPTPVPVISIIEPKRILSPSGVEYFPAVEVSNSFSIDFAIENIGNEILNVTGTSITGDFSTNISIPLVIDPSGVSNFSIDFSPTVSGVCTGNISFDTDDAENYYSITLSGYGI